MGSEILVNGCMGDFLRLIGLVIGLVTGDWPISRWLGDVSLCVKSEVFDL